MRDDELMGRAIQLARTARRHTAPKPAVGCVIVRDGEIVGTGATEPSPAGAHAEAVALREAGERAAGSTVYSTLEPCNHFGTTPPCAEALVDAGVARVVVAVDDPDARVAGRGYARLRDAGIEVVTGVRTEEAARDLAPYLHHRRTGSAFVIAKIALSLDGRVAARDGTSQWITGPVARADVHELRADVQAIVVGAGTAIADRPSLTVRDVGVPPLQPPLRVLLDAGGRVPADGPLFDVALAPTLVITTERARHDAVDAWRASGAKVETVAAAPDGNGVALDEVFALLGSHGVLSALVEGGGTLLGSLVESGCVQRLVAYVAPTLLGADGQPGFAFGGPATIADAHRYALADVRQLGDDVRLDYELMERGPMFTGIIEELGKIRAITPNADGARVEIEAIIVLEDAVIGASIAVNGCCVTVVELGDGWWAADAVTETLQRTTFGDHAPGELVNLERPVRLADRLGGHLVQGHVDATGTVRALVRQPDGSVEFRFDAPPEVMRYVVHKGSVTVDGISLTVAAVHDDGFSVAIIPHTLAVTTLGFRQAGDGVNLECDVVAKYVERLLMPSMERSSS